MASEVEKELISRCRQGEEAAWDELFTRFYPMAGRFVHQLSPSFTPEDVEEICQEVFLAVIRNLQNFQGHSQFQTWLFRIAANKARDFITRQHAEKRGGGQPVLSLEAENPDTGMRLDPPGTNPGPDTTLMTSEQAELLHQALVKLGDPCQEIIELRYFGDLSYEEISYELQLNPKTVSSRLSKCLDKLEEITRGMLSREKSAASSV